GVRTGCKLDRGEWSLGSFDCIESRKTGQVSGKNDLFSFGSAVGRDYALLLGSSATKGRKAAARERANSLSFRSPNLYLRRLFFPDAKPSFRLWSSHFADCPLARSQ